MRKRLVKKLAKKGVEEMKTFDEITPISSRKVQLALWKYLTRNSNRNSKLTREFWDLLEGLRL